MIYIGFAPKLIYLLTKNIDGVILDTLFLVFQCQLIFFFFKQLSQMQRDEVLKNEIRKEIMKTDLPINKLFLFIIFDSEIEAYIHTTEYIAQKL